ncbi:tyrosine-type recombinase/integrase [Listeria valentina]|uniref:tyrosine-type recombinase/integrase n=1 Tax=Listeria valentina TaxID=2705293 RepID=UPI001FE84414|nr:site-specific integrase [Listeria valentina]
MPIIKTEKGYKIDISLGYDPITGKQRRIKKKNIKTKAEAENLIAYYKRLYYQSALPVNQKTTFEEIGQTYFSSYTVNHKPTYIRTQKGYYNHRILPYFKNTLIAKTNKKVCIEFRDYLLNDNKNPLSNNSINKHMILLKKIFDVAIDENLISINPCNSIKKLKVEKEKMKFWTPLEFKQFINSLKDNEYIYKVFYTTAYLTGMRSGEMLALKWEDIDFLRNEIHVNKTLSRVNKENIITSPKSSTSNRYITINSKLSSLLQEWKNYQSNLLQSYLLDKHSILDAHVFQYNMELPARENFSTKKIQKICKRTNLTPIRLHDFRHSHVALLINNNEDTVTIKERMGHASITTTIDTYGHLFPNKQKSMSDKFDNIF